MKRNAYAHSLVSKICGFHFNFRVYYRTVSPKLFVSGGIKKVEKGVLRSCAHSNLGLLSFNVPEYRLLQACFNVVIPAHLVNISCISANICTLYPLTLTPRVNNKEGKRVSNAQYTPCNMCSVESECVFLCVSCL